MPLFTSPDGRYLFAMQTAGEGDGNSVVYDRGVPVWDRFSHERKLGEFGAAPPPNPPPAVRPDIPIGGQPVPSPAAGGGRVIRVSDGPFAPRMMSDRANAWVSGPHAYVFAGSRATGGPLFFQVDLYTEQVGALGPKIHYGGETEGWYWTRDGKVMVLDGPRLRRVDPFTGADEIVLDISRSSLGRYDLWQPHSSDDGRTHSATVREIVAEGKYPYVATVIAKDGQQRFIGAVGVIDESQVARLGGEVVIKEIIKGSEDNRIFSGGDDLATWTERRLTDAEGAIGHSDCGPDFIVGEANLPEPGRCVRVDLRTLARVDLFQTWNMGYVSVRAGRCLLSDQTHLSLVALDGSGVTILRPHYGSSDYDGRVKANLSPCGRVATYMVHGAVKLLAL